MRSLFIKRRWIAAVMATALIVLLLFVFVDSNQIQLLQAEDSFRFVVMSDSQGPNAVTQINEKRLRQLLERVDELPTQPSFLLFGGDMVYGKDNVVSALNEWKDIVDDYFPLKKVYPAIGNHEDEKSFNRAFAYLPKNQLPGYEHTVYYFDYKNCRFIVLNSRCRDDNYNYIITDEQLDWLEKALANSNKDHNFVMFHLPAYPVGKYYRQSLDTNPKQRNALWDIIDNYHVTAVFVGHEHNYNRRLIDETFDGYGYSYENEIYQITVGSSGGETNRYVKDAKNVKGPYAVYCYTVVDVKDNVVYFNVYDINNRKIDSFKVRR